MNSLRTLFSSSSAHNCSVRKLICFSEVWSNGFDFLLEVSVGSLPSISTSFFIFARAAGPGSRFRTRIRSLCASVSSFAILFTLSRCCLCATSAARRLKSLSSFLISSSFSSTLTS
ncbi:hypothetical protein HanRHA438_Chr09g0409471 [Helianthus annuus]|nr:hypothetical protein HanIR_Chr09g0428621 [Helianthus annuus]KAJ0889122.1 hypothetical protein HanRHA438_Chr09g0409471 [Helianthus annuus]